MRAASKVLALQRTYVIKMYSVVYSLQTRQDTTIGSGLAPKREGNRLGSRLSRIVFVSQSVRMSSFYRCGDRTSRWTSDVTLRSVATRTHLVRRTWRTRSRRDHRMCISDHVCVCVFVYILRVYVCVCVCVHGMRLRAYAMRASYKGILDKTRCTYDEMEFLRVVVV